MKKIVIEGNKTLSGTIKIGGAKNSAVSLIPAAILSDGIVTIENVPEISDATYLGKILDLLNVKLEIKNNTYTIDCKNATNNLIPEELSSKLRASYYFMGALLGKFKKVEMFFPGGCNIGQRPIDMHLSGFEALGAKITKEDSKYIIEAEELIGSEIVLEFASVGATVNIMLASVKATGVTKIINAAREVEICNLADLLRKMGAKITGDGTDTIIIEGVDKLGSGDIKVIPDRIEAGTYIIIGAMLGKDLVIEGIVPQHIKVLLNKLRKMGANFKVDKNKIILNKVDKFRPTNIRTFVYPGFPTDLGQPITVLLTQASGISLFEETIWENRLGQVPYLNQMGACIKAQRKFAKIAGPTKLHGEEITATDLRAGASLVIAGLIAEGTTIISDVEHILRGYERIINKLSDVGANIKIIEV